MGHDSSENRGGVEDTLGIYRMGDYEVVRPT